MPRRFACPHCDAVLKLSDTLSPRTKVRCPECDAVFTLPADDEGSEAGITRQRGRSAPAYDDEDEERDPGPRRRRRQPQGSSTAMVLTLIGVGLGALVLVGGGVAAGLYWMRKAASPVAQTTMPQPQSPLQSRPQLWPPPGLVPPGGPGRPQPGGPAQPPSGSQGGTGTQVGMTAKEIEGEDIDGKQFKLSDYRGKVVLLDFWGHW